MDRKLVYRVEDGLILANIPINSEYEYLYNFPTSHVVTNGNIENLINYKIKNQNLVELEDFEKDEVRKHGRVLTEGERLLIKLRPTSEEINNAKQTINTINLIQEVMI